MTDIRMLLAIIVSAFFRISKNKRYDDELTGISYTYERPKLGDRSNTYHVLNKLTAITHLTSFVGMLLLEPLYRFCINVNNVVTGYVAYVVFIAVFILSYSFLLDWPLVVFIGFRTNRRAKLWAKLTNNKKKLTNMERHRIQTEFDRIWRKRWFKIHLPNNSNT